MDSRPICGLGAGSIPRAYMPPRYAPWRQLTSAADRRFSRSVHWPGPTSRRSTHCRLAQPAEVLGGGAIAVEANPPPGELSERLSHASNLCIAEEHVDRAVLPRSWALFCRPRYGDPDGMRSLHARAHVYDAYGSQPFLRIDRGSTQASVLSAIARWSISTVYRALRGPILVTGASGFSRDQPLQVILAVRRSDPYAVEQRGAAGGCPRFKTESHRDR